MINEDVIQGLRTFVAAHDWLIWAIPLLTIFFGVGAYGWIKERGQHLSRSAAYRRSLLGDILQPVAAARPYRPEQEAANASSAS